MIPKFMLIPLLLIAAVSIYPVYGLAPFVDESRDPQSYVDRYHTEPSYKEWFDENYPEYDSIYEAVGLQEPIPTWIKNSALWYGQGELKDNEFFNMIQFLLDRNIIKTPNTDNSGDSQDRVSALELELSELKSSTVRDIQGAYDDGYRDGSSSAGNGGDYNTGYNAGYDQGHTHGYSEGIGAVSNGLDYENGFNDGFVAGEANGVLIAGSERYDIGYNDGYAVGYRDGSSVTSGSEYNDGINGPPSISFRTDSKSYSDGDTITITGNIENHDSGKGLTFQIISPDNDIVTVGNFTPNSDGTFEITSNVGGALWKSSGDYKIKLNYGATSSETTINYVGGSQEPEPTITVKTDSDSYSKGQDVIVTGKVTNPHSGFPVSILAKAPNGNIVSIQQVYPNSNGNFEAIIEYNDQLMKSSGYYTVVVQYGTESRSSETTFNYVSQIITNDEVTVEAAQGSGTPGCEETYEGCYIPSTATVDVGGVVIFTNPDTVAHTYTSGSQNGGPDGVFDSSLVVAGASFAWTPTTVGEQPYFCIVHPWMRGVIIVQEVGAAEGDHHSDHHSDHHDDRDGHMDSKGHLIVDPSATGMMSDGRQVSVWTSEPMAGERMQVHVEFEAASHVNHDITVTQNGETVLDDMGAHHHEGSGMHETAPLSSDDPVDITITFQGYGIDDPKEGPIGEQVAFTNVFPGSN